MAAGRRDTIVAETVVVHEPVVCKHDANAVRRVHIGVRGLVDDCPSDAVYDVDSSVSACGADGRGRDEVGIEV